MIGLLTVRLLVRDSRSLKDKRQVARSILDRLKNQFAVAAAETDTQDDHKIITLGITAVGAEMEMVRNVLQTIQEALRAHPIAEYLNGELMIGTEVV